MNTGRYPQLFAKGEDWQMNACVNFMHDMSTGYVAQATSKAEGAGGGSSGDRAAGEVCCAECVSPAISMNIPLCNGTLVFGPFVALSVVALGLLSFDWDYPYCSSGLSSYPCKDRDRRAQRLSPPSVGRRRGLHQGGVERPGLPGRLPAL
jgi:hypothetical protein